MKKKMLATMLTIFVATQMMTVVHAVDFVNPQDCQTKYFSGQYKVGQDIPAGEYVIFPSETNRKGFYFETLDANGDQYDDTGSVVTNGIVMLDEGNYIELDHAYAIPIEENPAVDTTGEGTFKVGYHIDAGEYKVSQIDTSRHGFYFVFKDSTKESYAASNSFDGSVYVSVSDGQVLELSNAKLEK